MRSLAWYSMRVKQVAGGRLCRRSSGSGARHGRSLSCVLDGTMLGLNGWTVGSALKSDPATSSIPGIIVTGAPDDEAEDRALRVGAEAFFREPLCPARLRATALAPLRKRRAG